MGLLLITHDLAVVSGMAHRVALMYAGQIIEVATADEFLPRAQAPVCAAAAACAADANKRGGSLAAIAGTVPPLWLEFEGCRFAPRCVRVFAACHDTRPELIDLGTRSVRWPALPRRPDAGGGADRRGRRRGSIGGGRGRRDAARRERPERALSDPLRCPAPRHRCVHGGRRHIVSDPVGRDARLGGRIGLRQDDDRQGDRATAAPAGRDHRQGVIQRAGSVHARRRCAAHGAAHHPDHLPGPVSGR